jgi:hypothetical protein
MHVRKQHAPVVLGFRFICGIGCGVVTLEWFVGCWVGADVCNEVSVGNSRLEIDEYLH